MVAPAVKPTLQGRDAAIAWRDFSGAPATFDFHVGGDQPLPALANTLRGGLDVQVLASKAGAGGPKTGNTYG